MQMCSNLMHCMHVCTSLCHIHHARVLVDSHREHVPGEEFRVLGPTQVQLVQGSAQQLVVSPEAGAALLLLGTDGAVQQHHEHSH